MKNIELHIGSAHALIVLATNHYITTADEISVGLFAHLPNTTDGALIIPVNERDPLDAIGYSLLVARLAKIQPYLRKIGVVATLSAAPTPRYGCFRHYWMVFPENLLMRYLLSGLLVSPLLGEEWGHSKPYVDAFCRSNPDIASMLRASVVSVAPLIRSL